MVPNFERRKEERPDQIVDAAFHEFAEKGFAETRLADVAQRAGVSKGLPYLYFKTKEELFKAVLKGFVKPGFERMLGRLGESEMTFEQFLRGPYLEFARSFVRSRRARVLRLLIAEGPKHPDLLEFYAKEFIAPMLAALGGLIKRAHVSGEMGSDRLAQFPQLIMAPVMVGALWQQLFQSHLPLDPDAMLELHVEYLLAAAKGVTS